MALNIPSPNESGTGFLQGLESGSELMRKLIANRIAQQADAREQQMQPFNIGMKQAQIKDYDSVAQRRLAQTRLEQQQEGRQQTLMPYHIQTFKDAHAKASQELPLLLEQYRLANGKAASDNEINKLYNDRIKFHLTSSINQDQNQSPAQQPQYQQQVAGVPKLTPDVSAQKPYEEYQQTIVNQRQFPPTEQPPQRDESQGLGVNQSESSYGSPQQSPIAPQPDQVLPIQQVAPDQVIPNVQLGRPNIAQQDIAPNANPMPNQQGIPAPNGVNQSPNQQPPNVANGANQTNPGEQIITPATKGMEFMDKIAGLPNSPIKAPVVKTGRDGSITTIYPSGKVTRTMGQAAESPQQKREAETTEAIKLAEAKSNLTVSRDVVKNGRNLVKTYNNLRKLKSLLEENKDATGFGKALAYKTKVHQAKNIGTINELTGTIQGDVANLVNPRSGIGTIKWAENVKPSIWNDTSANLEMVNSALEHVGNDLSEAAEEHKNLTGKDLPFKLPEMGNSLVTVEIPGGKTIQLPKEGADKLVKDHPDHKIVG